MATPDRLEVLGRRVRWLDRYHRAISIPLALVGWLVIAYRLAAFAGAERPGIGSWAVGLVLAAAAWEILDIAFGWTISLLEMRYEKLFDEKADTRGLPRAQLRRSRAKRVLR